MLYQNFDLRFRPFVRKIMRWQIEVPFQFVFDQDNESNVVNPVFRPDRKHPMRPRINFVRVDHCEQACGDSMLVQSEVIWDLLEEAPWEMTMVSTSVFACLGLA